MAEYRERPYGQFNYLVEITGGPGADDAKAGFQEVSGLSMEVPAVDYRVGNSKINAPIKVNGVFKVGDVTLKRGVIGSTDLWTWLKAVSEGKQDQRKTVKISLRDEAREKTAQTWTLSEARPIKYTGPNLAGKGGDVAVEELVLAYETLAVE